MTPDELTIVQLNCKILSQQILLRMLCQAFGRASPSFLPSLRETGSQMQEEYLKIAMKGLSPEYSDLIAGEFQDALDDLLKFVDGEKK